MRREDLVKEALEWLDTPFHANQRAKGIGTDCIGMVGGSAANVGIVLLAIPRAYALQPDGSLKRYLDKYLVTVTGRPQPGDVLLISIEGGEPHHVAMLVNDRQIVHAHLRAGKVVKQDYTKFWQQRTVAIYRFPEVE